MFDRRTGGAFLHLHVAPTLATDAVSAGGLDLGADGAYGEALEKPEAAEVSNLSQSRWQRSVSDGVSVLCTPIVG